MRMSSLASPRMVDTATAAPPWTPGTVAAAGERRLRSWKAGHGTPLVVLHDGRTGGPKPPGKGTMPEYYGDPDTVVRQIREDAKRIGYGVVDLNFDSFHLPHERALHSLELFGTEVLPQLHAS